MNVVYYSKEVARETDFIFGFNGINLIRTEDETENIDFVPFPSVRLLAGFANPISQEDFKNELRNHPNYDFYKKNTNLPIIFYHRFEFLHNEVYELFIKLVCEELNTKRQKIILLDSSVNTRKGVITPPKFIQLKQFNFKTFDFNDTKNKKFSYLTNRNNKLRTQILDKVLYGYNNNVPLLKEENILSFRNYKLNEPSNDISDIKNFINDLTYEFKNDYDFFKSLDLPWVIDDFKIGEGYIDMYNNLYEIYSNSYFSLIVETQYYYSDLNFDTTQEFNIAFSEKGLIPLHCGNLPFVIHYSDYYNRLEEVGFDFSYLKILFNIDYKTNTLKENFNSIEKFISYFKNNKLEAIKNDYIRLIPIIESNTQILKDIESSKLNTYILEFYTQIKQEKNK